MSSGRRSDEKFLALANTSLGRRQITPASFCSADNSSRPSGSLFSNDKQSVGKKTVSIPFLSSKSEWGHHLNNVPVVPTATRLEEGFVHKGAATPLIVDPFCNTRCCSSAYNDLTPSATHPKNRKARSVEKKDEPSANGSRHTGAKSALTAFILFARSTARAAH
jgi:hypothetical protein